MEDERVGLENQRSGESVVALGATFYLLHLLRYSTFRPAVVMGRSDGSTPDATLFSSMSFD
jgi:hypothetical protein